LEVFEEVLQGVRAGIFPKELEDFSIKLRRDRIFEAVEENLRRFSTLKHSKGRHCKVTCKADKFQQRNTVFTSQESSRRHWTVEILHGEFAKSQELSDCAEE
jgi:hypothetical protein